MPDLAGFIFKAEPSRQQRNNAARNDSCHGSKSNQEHRSDFFMENNGRKSPNFV
jgi:hypothetical protein